jgi:hypothetical protein
MHLSSTYNHRVWKTGLPVRSAVLKPHAGELVVGWVTTSESSLLYVFCFAIQVDVTAECYLHAGRNYLVYTSPNLVAGSKILLADVKNANTRNIKQCTGRTRQ